jgi:hypothetical protein
MGPLGCIRKYFVFPIFLRRPDACLSSSPYCNSMFIILLTSHAAPRHPRTSAKPDRWQSAFMELWRSVGNVYGEFMEKRLEFMEKHLWRSVGNVL